MPTRLQKPLWRTPSVPFDFYMEGTVKAPLVAQGELSAQLTEGIRTLNHTPETNALRPEENDNMKMNHDRRITVTNLNETIGLYSGQIISLRRAIHSHPELGTLEYHTAALVESTLSQQGLEVITVGETGIVAVLRGAHPGKTIAFRADMDALPIQEDTACSFASQTPGVMHACGHDVHTAALLGAALLLSHRREELHGDVIFVFEPDEEGSGSAKQILVSGLLKNADAIFGAHVDPDLPEGALGIRYGKFYAASDVFQITVEGKSAHAATPERGIDATYAAALLACRLKALPELLQPERAVVTVGTLSSGTAGNILSGSAALSGIIRTLGQDSRLRLRQALLDACRAVEQETGARIIPTLRESYPGIVNSDAETAFAEACGVALLGKERVHTLEQPTMTTEDFGCYLAVVPGSFYHIGAGSSYPLHNSRFLPTDKALLTAAAVHTAVALSFLQPE